MLNRPKIYGWVGLIFVLPLLACGDDSGSMDDPWPEVQNVLAETKDIVVLDGIKKGPVKYTGTEEADYGDWLVQHTLSDPENFNPYTSSDVGATAIHNFVFESLLYSETDPPYTQKG